MISKHTDHDQYAKQNIEALDIAQTPRASLSRIMSSKTISSDEEARKILIQFQYKMLQMYGPLFGIYAIPNLNNYNIWNCIIFVRKGFYKDGKFKFDLIFPSKFPQICPQITFKSPIYHPLVKEFQGVLDINRLINSQWKYTKENMLYMMFSNIQKMFIHKQYMEIRDSYNDQAAKLILSKPHAFIEKALASVEISKDNLYSNQHQTSLVIKKYKNNELDPFKNKLESLCQQNKAPQQKRKQFLEFLFAE